MAPKNQIAFDSVLVIEFSGRTLNTAASTHLIQKGGSWNMMGHIYIYVCIYIYRSICACANAYVYKLFCIYIYICILYPLDIFNHPMVGLLFV